MERDGCAAYARSAQLRALDLGASFASRFAGTRILTLAEGLALARGRVNLYLDCKVVDAASLAQEVIAAKMSRQVVIYDTPEMLRAVRTVATEELALMTKWRCSSASPPGSTKCAAAVEIDAGDVTPQVCRAFHERGIKVQAKTLDRDDRPEVGTVSRRQALTGFKPTRPKR